MTWIFLALLVAAGLHVAEEYGFPGGFPAFMKQAVPPFAAFITVPFALLINGLFLSLCAIAALVSTAAPLFSLSVACLCGINGLSHLAASLRMQRYAPGLLTGLALYLPLAGLACFLYLSIGMATLNQALLALLLGALLQAVPLIYLGAAYLLRGAGRA